MSSAEQYMDEINTGRTVEQWLTDPCYALVFGTIKQTVLQSFVDCKTESDGPYDLKLMMSAIEMIDGAAREFVRRGEVSGKKLTQLRDKEQRERDRQRYRA
jgi:hypothetical protein